MTKRIIAAVLVSAVVLVACGSDSDSAAGDDSLPPVADGDQRPVGADEVIVSYTEVGGFTTPEVTFQQTPVVLISGDATVYTPGAQIAIFPGPLLPTLQVQTITEEGIDEVLAAAEEAGLFNEVDYEAPNNIADATTSRVVISANGETWVHEAYALTLGAGIGTETPERQALLDFIIQLTDLPTLVGAANLGETALYEPMDYAIEARPVEDLSVFAGDGIEPTVVEWPADVSVPLADASACTVVPATEIGETLAAANQLTFFSDDGITYQVLARPVLPGSTCG
jgi:hypothetical protein